MKKSGDVPASRICRVVRPTLSPRSLTLHGTMLWLLALALSGVAYASKFDPAEFASNQGTYRNADGTCAAGGRMDEDGIRLLYMDVWMNQAAVLLSSQGGTLGSLVPPGIEASVDVSGDTLTLTHPGEAPRVARRLHRMSGRVATATVETTPMSSVTNALVHRLIEPT